MEVLNIPAQKRVGTGKKSNKDVRNAGRIPGVLYGNNDNVNFSVVLADVKKLIYTPDFKVAELEIDGSKTKAIVKDLQFHPVTDKLMHIDLLRMVEGTPLKVEIPIRFKGTSPGVKSGGKLIQQMRRVKVKATPENLVSELFADISTLELGDSVRVSDLEISEHIQLMTEGATPIGLVDVPRALKSAAAAEEADAAAAPAAAPAAE